MATKMSQVSTEDLINSIYDAENKLQKASAQLVLLQNKTHEAKVRYDKSRENGNQPHCYSVYLQLTTLQGTSAMYHHYMEVKGTPTGVAALLLHEEDWNVLERLPVRVGHN